MGRTRRIITVGVELEGAWDRDHDWDDIYSDGSVGVIDDLGLDCDEFMEGELQSPGLAPEAILTWIRDNYPTKGNATCGIHVHMRLKHDLYYQKLMSPDYADGLYQDLRDFADDSGLPLRHQLRQRLNGGNYYCGVPKPHTWVSQTLATGRVPVRYQGINFCRMLHNTVEVRVLPYFAVRSTAIKAVKCIIDSTDAFLALAMREREKWHVATWEEETSTTGALQPSLIVERNIVECV